MSESGAVQSPRSIGRWLKALSVVALCSYLPFSWVALITYPWGEYRLLWLKMWPILPGFLAALPMPPTMGARLSAMAAATLLLFACNTLLATRGRWQFCFAALLSFALATFSSFCAYAAFRM